MRKLQVITPEQVSIDYSIADLGSRVGAVVVDMLIQMVVVIALVMADLAIMTYSPEFWSEKYGWVIGLSILVYMVISYVYYIWAEINFDGQTIGKKMMSIRVIRLNGQPVGVKHIVIRNLFKVLIDSMGFGVWMIIFNKQSRRIGDFVGGTVVIHKLSVAAPEIMAFEPQPEGLERLLTKETIDLYRRYSGRKNGLNEKTDLEDEVKSLMLMQCGDDHELISKVESLF
ncbi:MULTISPECIES: RDD family protein [unclassified Fusibacter]|uniref:RDD family protein n=1 Tax=unclassified Fusibacter TaxID=2624464 RepID=UPI0010134220|nr:MULTISPECIES: RDD family protein [unclassified Fusibacter]MCK8058639.1 RDD family protein [Fusibacter sp. A2]NPE21714.1 RDD family protein [Fusibacter sp. A1]RXV61289.1 RDD family protein [Fusibacter sp. A1]